MTGTPIDGIPGWRHLELMSVGSTNAEAIAIAGEGDAGHLWVTAGEQTAGRGRRGRGWTSPPGNLYASALLVDPAPLEALAALPLVAAVAVRNAIAACGLPPGAKLHIKWPNDILLNGAKCCGMLLESNLLAGGRRAVVIGCGINVVSHPEPGNYPATALNREGVPATPATLFAHLARALADALDVWNEGRGAARIRSLWLEHARGIGEPITVNLANRRIEGIFEDIDREGMLLMRDRHGAIRPISAGDLFFDNPNNRAHPAPAQEQE